MVQSNYSSRSLYFLVTGDPIPSAHIKYPCVVKASKGEDSKSVRLVKDQQSEKTGDIKALSCMEYNVPAKNIREDKLLCADEKGLPVCCE